MEIKCDKPGGRRVLGGKRRSSVINLGEGGFEEESGDQV